MSSPETPESEEPMPPDSPVEPPVDSPAKPRGFDLRVLIAGLLGLYGAVLTVLGVTDDAAALAKADGIRINLWIGLGLLAVAAAFALWVKLAPQRADGDD